MGKGGLICFEGIDGSGKTTQVALLRLWLTKYGHRCVVTDTLDIGPFQQILGSTISSDLPRYARSLLFAFSNYYRWECIIKPAVESGSLVLSDRFILSSISYLSARGVNREWLLSLYEPISKPDLSFILDVPASAWNDRRRGEERESYYDQPFLDGVRKEFLSLAGRTQRAIVIDGTKDKLSVHCEILHYVSLWLTGAGPW